MAAAEVNQDGSSLLEDEDDVYHVLLTGFGDQPFFQYKENPSWLAVKPLHNTIINLEDRGEPIVMEGTVVLEPKTEQPSTSEDEEERRMPKRIHMSALQIPVKYDAVMESIPGLHSRPPLLPEWVDRGLFPPPPTKGYDLMFHIGVAGRGPLRVEKASHKLGYKMKDAAGCLAPLVETMQDFDSNRELMTVNMGGLGIEPEPSVPSDSMQRSSRGFGTGYEKHPDELVTDVDLMTLMQDLKQSGVEQIYTSMDAGHYVADFAYYCSLAEAGRSKYENGRGYKAYDKESRGTTVLLMHCPPVGQPLSSDEVTDAIKRIVSWIALHKIR